MKIVIKKRAQNTLERVAGWIADNYFPDTAIKWLDDFNNAIQEIAKTGVKYAICNHESLARYQYRCLTYKSKWIIAYNITPAKLTIYRFVLGSRLK